MAKALVIVESPAKAKTINKYLGRDYKVIASMRVICNIVKLDDVPATSGCELDAQSVPQLAVPVASGTHLNSAKL